MLDEPSLEVSIAPEADEELFEGHQFYLRTGSVRLGEAFLLEFERSMGILRSHPDIGRIVRGSIRRLSLRRFPYSIVYRLKDAQLRVLAIAHQRRRPGYWTKRIR